jgi:hypothetical protein
MTVVVGITLLLVAALLIAANLQAWRTADHGGLGEAEREFHARRFRRRWQASALVGFVGLLILGDLAMERFFKEDLARLLYWCGVVVLLLWLLLLAAGDWLASRAYYHREWNRLRDERSSLRADVARLRREHRERKDQSGESEVS